MTEAVVVYDYQKQQDDEVDLVVGSVVLDVKQVDEGWCEGTVNGVRGMFPDNFVKLRAVGSTLPPMEGMPATAMPRQEMPLQQSRTDSAKKSWRARVTYSYAAENADEIDLDPGQVIDVLVEEEEGWWRGRANGREGLFPSNFVQSITEDELTDSKHYKMEGSDVRLREAPKKSPEKGPDTPPARQSMFGPKLLPEGVNPLEARSKLKSTPKSAPPIPTKEEPRRPPQGGRPPAPPPPPEKHVEKAKVLFEYVAEEADELSVKVGDIVEVVTKDAQEGWWEVQLGDDKGLVPDNFVESIKSSSSAPAKRTDPPKESAPAIPGKPPAKKPPGPSPPEPKRPPPPHAHSRPELKPPADTNETDGDFGVPNTTPLDNSAVKNRPKKAMSRPPSRVNLQETATHEEGPPAIPPQPATEEPKLTPWQAELQKRRTTSKPPPPKPAVVRKPPIPAKVPPPLQRMRSPSATEKPKPPLSKPAAPPPKPQETKPAVPPPPTHEATLPTVVPTAVPSRGPIPIPPPQADTGWKEAFDSLREEFTKFKADCLKDIEILTKDLDEERKTRRMLEVDVDRLKKTRGFRDVL